MKLSRIASMVDVDGLRRAKIYPPGICNFVRHVVQYRRFHDTGYDEVLQLYRSLHSAIAAISTGDIQ